MRIAVCIKQVPVVSAMQFDETSKTLKREGVPCEVSAFDVRALLKAVELRDQHGGEVVVVTMGPPAAREALVECLALGADRALHLNDRAFAGADTLATSRALAAALRPEGFDLILCGRNSVDAETGHVGPQLAALLGLPQITCARSLSMDANDRHLIAERELDDGLERVRSPLPVVVTAAEDLAPERFPNKAEREAAKTKPIVELHADDLGLDAGELGAAGSPTWVAGLHAIASNRLGRVLDSSDTTRAATELVQILLDQHGLFSTWKVHEQAAIATIAEQAVSRTAGSVCVLAEVQGGQLRPVTLELLAKARQLADALQTEVTVLLCGGGLEAHAATLAQHGADQVHLADDPALQPFHVEVHAPLLAQWIRAHSPRMVLAGATSMGRDLLPRLAALLQLGLTSDCVDLGLDGEGRLIQYKPAFGGLIVAPILSRTHPELATVRPGMLALAPPDPTRQARLQPIPVNGLARPAVQILAHTADAAGAPELDSAEIIIGVGKGIGARDSLSVIQPLADVLGAPLCATRDVTDEGWLPKQVQVGLTGRAVAPKLYIAIGIRGAFEHTVGVRRAGVIVAINKSPKAPIFKSADYGIVGDYAALVPALSEQLAQAKRSRA